MMGPGYGQGQGYGPGMMGHRSMAKAMVPACVAKVTAVAMA